MRYLRSLITLFRTPYHSVIQITVFRDRILHNLHTFQKKAQQYSIQIAPVLKSNAYGHGLIPVAGIVAKENIPFIIVDSYHEALTLRREGIHTPLLLMGYTPIENIVKTTLRNIAFSILSTQQAEACLQHIAKPTTFHLKIDTGMSRLGVPAAEIQNIIALLKKNKNIIITGVYSHLADPDNTDSSFTEQQIRTWNTSVQKIRAAFPAVTYFHLAATAGMEYVQDIDCNLLRLGLGLYGYTLSPRSSLQLQPALRMTTQISGIKKIQPGMRVGYNGTFIAEKEMSIATIPAGYYEGIDRRLSNRGVVTVDGVPCPIIGRVSMNITTIDVSDVPRIHLQSEVVVYSEDSAAPNAIGALAHIGQTIPYELLVHLPQQLRRTVQ